MFLRRYRESRMKRGGRDSNPGQATRGVAMEERIRSNRQLRLERLPIHFFAVAVTSFGLGVVAAPWVVDDLVEFFYQPWGLALTHTFTLGWITAALPGGVIRFPGLALLQRWLFVVGVVGMGAHFVIGYWIATWLAAGVVVLSVALFALNMLPCLIPSWRRGGAGTGRAAGNSFLLIAPVLGLLLAVDKTFGFLGGSVITNLAGHAHLAALGWVSLTICAVSYRMVPAFLLPGVELPRAATGPLYGLAVAVG